MWNFDDDFIFELERVVLMPIAHTLTPEKIDSFSKEYRFLSNFYIEPDGTNVECEYQKEKCVRDYDRVCFYRLNPYAAKKLGKKIKIRPDWEQIKIGIMSALVLKKFEDNKELANKLLDTGDKVLEEGNNWGDTFWGTVNGQGQNMLGKILMTVRLTIREKRNNATCKYINT